MFEEDDLLVVLEPELLLVGCLLTELELLLDVEDEDLAVEFVDGVLVTADRLVTPEDVRVPFGL